MGNHYWRDISILLWCMSGVCVVCDHVPHPAVLDVWRLEDGLPVGLRSPALYNPALRYILPLTSLPHHGEQLVSSRPSDVVPRDHIYAMLTHAGLARRRPTHTRQPLIDPPPYTNQDLLQYL